MSNVMIVDDEEWICSVLKDYLEETGIHVDVAGNLAQARSLLAAGPIPEALILDLTLPDGNGVSFLKELQAGGRIGNTPVFLFTAHVLRESEMEKLMACGFVDLIPKPFKLGEFRSRLQQYLKPELPIHDPHSPSAL